MPPQSVAHPPRHLGTQWRDWSDPEMYALMVMNDILGGGGFTSRLTKRIRSDEGLAYGASSGFGIGTFWRRRWPAGSSRGPPHSAVVRTACQHLPRSSALAPSVAMGTNFTSFASLCPAPTVSAGRQRCGK